MEKIVHSIYKNFSNDSFFFFYNKIILLTQFFLIKTDVFADFIEKNKLNENNIIYSNNNITILYKNETLDKICNNIYVVPDPIDTNRFFIGLSFHGSYTSILVTGIFVYFDSKGNVSEKIIIPSTLINYDFRNGKINEKNTFLYNQTLIFLTSHRDSRNYMITMCCFDYYDNLLAIHNDFTNIKSDYFFTKNYVKNYRFLVLYNEKNQENYYNKDNKDNKDDENNYKIIDMASVYVENNNDNENKKNSYCDKLLIYNMYTTKTDKLDEKLLELESFPKQNYSDNYIKDCIKCGKLTSMATYYYNYNNPSSCVTSMIGLGKSYCHDCGIRYSLSDKVWLCCKPIAKEFGSSKNFDLCFCKLEPANNYICDKEKSHSNIKLIYKAVQNNKKPYKFEGNLYLDKNETDNSNLNKDNY